jgi:tRNA(Ile)-lysidine synthase TilS/MesJ
VTIEPASHEPELIDAHIAGLLARCTFAKPGTLAVCALSGGPDSAALVALAVAVDLDVHSAHIEASSDTQRNQGGGIGAA